jgi:hypothetical protein
MRITTAAVMALLATATAAAGQVSRGHMRSELIEGSRHTSIEADGELRLGDGEVYVAPGGRLVITDERPGAPDRRVEYRNDGGGMRRRFFRDGRETAPDASDEAWLRSIVEDMTRESGAGAPDRVARLYRSGGARAVLADIRKVASDGAKRAYYTALLRQPGLRAGETAEVLEDAGMRIASDGDKRMVLATLLDRPSIRANEMAAMLRAASNIASDGDKSSLLVRAAMWDALGGDGVREEFFRTARGIASDGDKARVLTSVPPAFLRDAEVRAAIAQEMQGIASDGDRSRVAGWLARSIP